MTKPTTQQACQVRVGVRIRPLTSQEEGQGGKSVLNACDPEIRLGERRFTYDDVFDAAIGQTQLYESVSAPLLKSFLEGYNATIMAYGQTGSGKTFTMGSEAHTDIDFSENTGLIPRFMNDLFEKLQQASEESSSEYSLQASFLEVYGEDVHDLLDSSRSSLPLREDANGGVVCAGLTHRSVLTAAQALTVLHEGTLNRTTAATLMNLTSSRSHAVFTIQLTQKQKSESSGGISITTNSRFTFVDLAGSERMKKTGAEGERAREGIKINEGLLALGNVINALADEERLAEGGKKKVHVPYRQSKLTRLLQDALGGNSQTLFLACVSPSDTNASETLSTLHYANRARNIKNAPTKNIDASILELQRLHTLNQVLQTELVKHKFGPHDDADSKMGEMDEELLQRQDVMEYLALVHSAAQEKQGPAAKPLGVPLTASSSAPLPMTLASPLRRSNTSLAMQDSGGAPNKSVMEELVDPALLAEVNPDEEMAILDQLLELQQQDHEFGEEQKKDHAQLKQVEGELIEQESMLLQLRESLKVYHDMKAKYEGLLAEVRVLEVEKAQLADQLETATADPSKGCSKAIKKELERVEKSLARARNETRKHREMYRKAEQEAKKCGVLERKIAEMKTSRAKLIKKQKEASARHREYTEAKTREILSLKRKERNNEKRVSKLQTEIQIHKKNLGKRQAYCNKLSAKLKQTEAHLMKLLSMRQRELRDRTSIIMGRPRRRTSTIFASKGQQVLHTEEGSFAPSSEAIDSINFLLDKAVSDKVATAELKQQYEETVAEYSESMRKMVAAVKTLQEAKDNTQNDKGKDSVQELELAVEDLELKVELVGEELEGLRLRLNNAEEIDGKENVVVEKLIKDKDAALLRTLLLDTIEKLSQSQLQRNRFDRSMKRKESALRSLEDEVETLNNRIEVLTKDIRRHRSLQTTHNDPAEVIQRLESEKTSLSTQLEEAQGELSRLNGAMGELTKQKDMLETESSEVKERLALADAALRQNGSAKASEEVLGKMQVIWKELGVSPGSREEIRTQIANCLDDTCVRKLEEATQMKLNTENAISELQAELDRMQGRLGVKHECIEPPTGTLLEQLESLRQLHSRLEPTFASAVERRDDIMKQATDLSAALGVKQDKLPDDLRNLIEGAASEQADLSEVFLSRCDKHLSALRVQKSQKLACNAELQQEAYNLVLEMNLTEEQILPLVLHSMKRRLNQLPDWWNEDSANTVLRAVAVAGGVVRVAGPFNMHLSIVHESLANLAKSRRKLSNTLRGLVERAQRTLLETVGGEVDAIEAYSSFHEALFRLPALSKELILACTSEIDALLSGVESMTQSEIEALSVVWEALNVSTSDRGKFWGEIDEATTEMQAQPGGPFDEVVHLCAVDGEEWVLNAVKDATKSYRQLETHLFKLERIHSEVERLRSRQDAKSKIISLDSEVRMLSTKLSEFEDKKCNKQRLLTKKTGSSKLLKEERFRKQMQQKYSSKLEQLALLLKSWKDEEGANFDPNLLSEEVRKLLENSDKMESYVEKRTEFMHLRTTTSTKRGAESIKRETGTSPPHKRQASASTRDPKAAKKPPASRRNTEKSSTRSRFAEDTANSRKRKAEAFPATATKLRRSSPSQKSAAPKLPRRTDGAPRVPLSPAHNPHPPTKGESAKKRLTLPPFGHVLEQALTPRSKNKENSTDSE